MGVRTRLAIYYAVLFGVLGVMVPFWPLWLAARGLGPESIALVLGAGQWVRIVASPAVGAYVDRSGRRRATMVALGGLAAAGFIAFGQVDGLVLFVLLSVLTNGAFIPLIPLADSLTLARERTHGISYGSVRLWGSVAFIAASVGCGEMLERASTDVVLFAMVTLTAATAVFALGLPDPAERGERAPAPPLAPLLKRPPFLLFVTAGALAQASHAVYYAFGSIHWEAAGHSSTIVGMLWALGVLAEVVLFVAGGRLTARFAPSTLIAVGASAGLVRWGILGASTALPALALAQLLHALTFGAVHLGAMSYLATRVPTGMAARGQTIYTAAVGGVAMGIAIPVAGPLYRAFEGGAFHWAAGLSAIATLLALGLGRLEGRRSGGDPT